MHWKSVTSTILGLAGAAFLLKGYRNTQKLEIVRISLPLRHLSPAFVGFKLLQLSDLHLSPASHRVTDLLAKIEYLDPDLICMTGDYLATVRALTDLRHFFAELSARRTVVGVLGNADHRPLISEEERQKWGEYFPIMNNSAICLTRQQEQLWVIGVDDPHSGYDRLEAALAPLPLDASAILLAHSPEIINRPLDSRIQFILSGHTHGGQICLPGGGALYHNTNLNRDFSSGLHAAGEQKIYISRGIGSTRLPLRYGCLPEITLFTLQQAVETTS